MMVEKFSINITDKVPPYTENIVTTVLIVSVFLIFFLFYLLFRNDCIHTYKLKILDEDDEWAIQQIKKGNFFLGKEFFPRYKSMASYNKMLLMFWVWPLSRFLKIKELKD